MKDDDLKSKVLSVMTSKELTVRQIMDDVNSNSHKQYAYTTIGTILKRLEIDGIVISKNKGTDKRNQKLFSIEDNAHKKEVSNFLRGLLLKFGPVGVRHLGEMLDTEINEGDIDLIRQKLNL
ncbi:MAG: hypothetical protein HeimC2_06820 [Candidatus Heimdallarchaeota archaeon LC_2]|nr:MAG: hypothetical protein HeimC2_06820 [Candidatus Heimdallarchaeota archaeon LC_2]